MELKYFRLQDFACSCCGANEIDKELVHMLDIARGIAGLPFIISSGYRCSKHDTAIGGKGNHPTGKAVDIRCAQNGLRFHIVQGLIGAGFSQIELCDKHVHVQDIADKPDFLQLGGKSL